MELRIKDKQQVLDVKFGNWLLSKIKVNLVRNFKKFNFTNWDTWLNETTSIRRLYDKTYTTLEIILFAADNLVCEGINGDIHIHFNNNIYVSGFDRWRLSSCIRTINFGTLDIKGCPIFTNTLDTFAEKIDLYVSMYYGSGVY